MVGTIKKIKKENKYQKKSAKFLGAQLVAQKLLEKVVNYNNKSLNLRQIPSRGN